MILDECFRWFGPADPVPLRHIRQAGATGVVTALHHLPPGAVWTPEEILARRREIAAAGLEWRVVESLPVSEDIKIRSGRWEAHVENYCASLRHLGAAGLRVVTYNFMPVLDWIRTDLDYELPDGSRTLRFERARFVAFELFILRRPGAERDYPPDAVRRAEAWFRGRAPDELARLERDIVDNFPGCAKGATLDDIRRMLARYQGIDRAAFTRHRRLFLEAVLPAAEEAGVTLAHHADDPPFSALGLPRIFSTAADLDELRAAADRPANGVCFCTGSFGARLDNDLPRMLDRCRDRLAFLHLRSTEHDADGNFIEAGHLEGNVDMYAVMRLALAEVAARLAAGRDDWRIPLRPDHGRVMLDDLGKPPGITPGYTAIGRLKGLAELRGLELGVVRAHFPGLREAARAARARTA